MDSLGEWHVSGSYYETCNCDAVCPCRRHNGHPGGRSIYGVCQFLLTWHVLEGHAGSIDLSGRRIAWPASTMTTKKENPGGLFSTSIRQRAAPPMPRWKPYSSGVLLATSCPPRISPKSLRFDLPRLISITAKGKRWIAEITKDESVMYQEREFLKRIGKDVTEAFAMEMINVKPI